MGLTDSPCSSWKSSEFITERKHVRSTNTNYLLFCTPWKFRIFLHRFRILALSRLFLFLEKMTWWINSNLFRRRWLLLLSSMLSIASTRHLVWKLQAPKRVERNGIFWKRQLYLRLKYRISGIRNWSFKVQPWNWNFGIGIGIRKIQTKAQSQNSGFKCLISGLGSEIILAY